MKNRNISQWAFEITQEIYSEYQKYDWEDGIKVFYSKVTEKPPLMIISYQPGGDVGDYIKEDKNNYENGKFEPPSKNAYKKSEEDKMSKRVKDLFGRPDLDYLLDASVVLPLIFFRASSIKVFRRKMAEKRLCAENYCFSKTKEIVEKLQPDRILVFGIGTFDQMLQCGIFKDVQVKSAFISNSGKSSKRRIFIASESPSHKISAIIHPSGARISDADWSTIKKLFFEWIKK